MVPGEGSVYYLSHSGETFFSIPAFAFGDNGARGVVRVCPLFFSGSRLIVRPVCTSKRLC